MKTNKPPTVFNDLKTLKTVRQQLKAQQRSAPAVPETAPKKDRFMALLNEKPTRNKTVVSAADKVLFNQAVRDVTPLKNSQRYLLSERKKTQAHLDSEQFKRRQQESLDHIALSGLYRISDLYSNAHDEQPQRDHLNALCGTDVLRNLKKGRWAIASSIDLHGSTLDQARLRLDYFLQHSLVEQYKCVRIVHGKGYGSKDSGPILPIAVRRWLSQLDFVLAYTDCSSHEGGDGAVKVLLRTNAHFSI